MPAHTTKLKKLQVVDKDSDKVKPGTSAKKESAEEEALRKICANQMAMGTMFMADKGNYNLLQIVLQATGPVEAWHHEQNKAL
eukprot:9378615-Lingulodinium_polyedra.AAC.1